MPLLVKDYSWTQTPSSICLAIPLKGANPRKVDVFATDEYLKVESHCVCNSYSLEIAATINNVYLAKSKR